MARGEERSQIFQEFFDSESLSHSLGRLVLQALTSTAAILDGDRQP